MQEGSEPNPSTTIRDDGKAIIVYQGSQPEYNTHLGITVQVNRSTGLRSPVPPDEL